MMSVIYGRDHRVNTMSKHWSEKQFNELTEEDFEVMAAFEKRFIEAWPLFIESISR